MNSKFHYSSLIHYFLYLFTSRSSALSLWIHYKKKKKTHQNHVMSFILALLNLHVYDIIPMSICHVLHLVPHQFLTTT
jgi:hypothetical protein